MTRQAQAVAPLVTAIVVTWNSRDTLGACLQSLMGQRGVALEVVVVDNGSADGSLELARQYAPDGLLIGNETNLGYAMACNQGLEIAGGDYVLLLNSDVVLGPDYLALLVGALAATPQAGWAAGKLLRLQPGGRPAEELIDSAGSAIYRQLQLRDRGAGEPDRGQYDRPEWVFGVSAAAALYKRAMLEDVAIDGQALAGEFFAYYEDADLSWRAQWRGWWCWYEPRAVAHHRRGHAHSRPLAIRRHAHANRLLMIARNASPGILAACALPWLAFELYLLARTVLLEPEMLPAYGKVWRLWPWARAARLAILGGRLVGDAELLRWFQPVDWWARLRTRGGFRLPFN